MTNEERLKRLEDAVFPKPKRSRSECPHEKTTYKAYGCDPGGKYYGEICDECGANTTKEEIYLR